MTGPEEVTITVEGLGTARSQALGTVANALQDAGFVVVERRSSAIPETAWQKLLRMARRQAAHGEQRLAVVMGKAP